MCVLLFALRASLACPSVRPLSCLCWRFRLRGKILSVKESLPWSRTPSRALPSRGGGGGTVASQGRSVPPARGGFAFSPKRAVWPLTSGLALWHNVRRRPRRVLLGVLSPKVFVSLRGRLFRPAAFRPVFELAGSVLVLIFLRPLKGVAKKQNKTDASALGFRVVFCFVFPRQNKTTSNPD